MKININDTVKVKLTDYGKMILEQHWNRIGLIWQNQPELEPDGTYGEQLWELMNIFGSEMYNGARRIFVNNEIQIEVGGIDKTRI